MKKTNLRFFSGATPNYADGFPVAQLCHAANDFRSTVRSARHDPRAVKDKHSDHTLFTRTYEDIEVTNGSNVQRILVPWSQSGFSQSKQLRITTFNAAMQGKKRGQGEFDYNTGLNIEETLSEYEDRTEHNGYLFGCAAYDSAIGNVQEGAKHTNGLARFQAGLDRASPGTYKIEDVTTWGLLTISNRRLLPQGLIKKARSPFEGKMNDLDQRIVTFKIPGYFTRFTTLHFPHGDPEQALTLYAKNKKENIFRAIEKGRSSITQVSAGDFNIRPEHIERALRSELSDLFPATLPVRTKCKILYNESGHRRTTGEDITVDASVSVSVEFCPSHLSRAQEVVASHREAEQVRRCSGQPKGL